MKKFLLLSAVILLVGGFVLGGLGTYIYFSARQECSDMVVRAQNKAKTAVAGTGTSEAEELKKDAYYARQGAMDACESFRERKTNAILFGSGALVSILISAVLSFFALRMNRRLG